MGGGVGVDLFSFFSVVLEKIIHIFHVYMSKDRQFKGLSNGMFRLTIPNHTFMHLTIFVHNITH